MDNYTRTIMTIIAVCLSIIVIQNASTSVKASGRDCGDSRLFPCYISVVDLPR